MKTLMLVFLTFLTIFVEGQNKCVPPEGPVYYAPGHVVVKKERKHFRHLEMWGVSDHSPSEFAEGIKRYHWIETKKPKLKMVHRVLRGTMVIKCWSNDDTGRDHLRIMSQGEVLFDKEFGAKDTFHFKFHFPEAQTLIFMVYNTSTYCQSPGAFLVAIDLKYYKQFYRRQNALIQVQL